MPKKVVLIGHCGADASYLRITVSRAARDAQVVAADDERELTQVLEAGRVELLLVNRQLDYGFLEENGAELIGRLRAKYPNLKTMLVSNYEDAQAEAVAAGALPGFGKREIGTPRVTQLLQQALAGTVQPA